MLLGAGDLLPCRPERVLAAGTSGAGKSTLAARIAALLDLPYVEIDALFHGPDWAPRETFEDEVRVLAAGPAWVTEWQYAPARPLLLARADLLVWLDLSRPVVLRSVTVRTLRRRLGRQVLWNGNLEPPLRRIFFDRDHIVRWAWSTHSKTTPRVAEVLECRPDLPVVRLRTRREIARWLDGPLRRAAAESDPPGQRPV